MTTPDNTPIIDKIRKLLALAENNGSEAEAELAMSKVNELLTKHNLEIDAIRDKKEVTFEREMKEYEWNASWIRTVYSGLSKLYFCKFYYVPNGTTNQRIYLIGEPVNIQTCQYVADHVIATGKRLAKLYATSVREEFEGTVGDAITASNDFKKGFALRISNCAYDLRQEIKKQMQPQDTGSTALVVADLYKRNEIAINSYMNDIGLKLSNGAGMNYGNAGHMEAGGRAANNVNLSARGLGAASGARLIGRR